jgi:Delta7-sterol 5-desaturase
MDLILQFADTHLFNDLYSEHWMPESFRLPADDWRRQAVSLYLITYLFGNLFYLLTASLSYWLLFDRAHARQHPKFLKNQEWKEIGVATDSVIWMTLYTVPWFLGEVRGWSRLTSTVEESGGVVGIIGSMVGFLFFTDMCIYWIHRWLHHPILYSRIHKPHHRWIVPTPFASHAFAPLDGYMQSLPYHMFVYLFPMHRLVYLFMFVCVNTWTVSIHDGEYMSRNWFVNGAANHTLHHLYFNYNYGQYFTIWDRIGGSYREPTDEQYDKKNRFSSDTMVKEARWLENMFQEHGEMIDPEATYQVEKIDKAYVALKEE